MSTSSPQEILNEAQKHLRSLQLDAAELREEFKANDLKRIISTLSQLSQQANNINSEQELLQFASNILSAIENDPTLGPELMGKIDAQAQEKRHLTIRDVEEGTTPSPSTLQEPRTIANSYQTMMSKAVELLQEKEDEEEKEE